MAASDVPCTVTGAWPSVVSTRAPMATSGSAMRRIGRRRSESSPSRTVVPSPAATSPERSRIVVPELPQSTAVVPAGPSRPAVPTMRTTSPSRSPRAPSARTAPSEDTTSAPPGNPVTTVVPSASAPRSSARCAIDLSPGTATSPVSPRFGAATRIAITAPRAGAGARGPRREPVRERRAVREQDLRPQRRGAPGDAGRVAEAAAGVVERRPPLRARAPRRADQRPGDEVREVRDPREQLVVHRRRHLLDARPDGLPQRPHARERRRVGRGGGRQDADAAAEEVRARGPGPRGLGPGDGVRADDRADLRPRRLQLPERLRLHAADVGEHRTRPRVRRERGGDAGARGERRREDDHVRGRGLARVARHAVDEPARACRLQALLAAAEAEHRARGLRPAGGGRERAADQPDARDREARGRGLRRALHGAPAARVSPSAFRKRSFSSGRPTVTRRCSGKPYASIGRTITPRRRSAW